MPVNATVAGTTRRLHKGNLRRKKEHAAPRPESRGQTRARTRRRAHEKHRAKAVRRTAGALKAGRSPGGAPAVMKDQAGAPARKKGSGTQRQSTRWEPEPEKKAVCPGQSATGCLPESGANEGHAQSTAACRTPGKAPRGKAGDNVRQRNGSRQSDQQTEQGASFQKTLYPTAECMGKKSTSARIRGKPRQQESAAAMTLASSTATCAGKRFLRRNLRPIARRRHTSAGRAASKGTTRTACMTKSCEKSPVGRKTTPERRWGDRLPATPCIREHTARVRAFKGDFVAIPQRCKGCDKNIEIRYLII